MSYYIPAYLEGMREYLTNPNVQGMYGMWDSPIPGDINGPNGPGVPGEGGVDLDSAIGTPVFALADGQVIASGYWNDQGHGVVTTRVVVPGYGENDLYYQHIIIDPSIQTGSTITRKQQIGTVGNFGEVELGFNANWGSVWGSQHPQGWVLDPRPLIKNLMDESLAGQSNGPTTGGTTGGGTLNTIGQWVAINIFREDATVVSTTNSATPVVYTTIGGVSLGLVAVTLLIAGIFIIGV